MRKEGDWILFLGLLDETGCFSEHIEIPSAAFSAEFSDSINLLIADYEVRRIGEAKFYIKANINIGRRATCARCLEAFETSEKVSAQAFIVPETEILSQPVSPNAPDFVFYNARMEFSLIKFIEEEMLLGAPMKMLCGEKCKGLCPHCGINKNFAACNCEAAVSDPRLQSLILVQAKLAKK